MTSSGGSIVKLRDHPLILYRYGHSREATRLRCGHVISQIGDMDSDYLCGPALRAARGLTSGGQRCRLRK